MHLVAGGKGRCARYCERHGVGLFGVPGYSTTIGAAGDLVVGRDGARRLVRSLLPGMSDKTRACYERRTMEIGIYHADLQAAKPGNGLRVQVQRHGFILSFS